MRDFGFEYFSDGKGFSGKRGPEAEAVPSGSMRESVQISSIPRWHDPALTMLYRE